MQSRWRGFCITPIVSAKASRREVVSVFRAARRFAERKQNKHLPPSSRNWPRFAPGTASCALREKAPDLLNQQKRRQAAALHITGLRDNCRLGTEIAAWTAGV